ncbi:hypothetical protein TSUD_245130 [Trifolium subterraneum]|uniref:AB hydrolase-1 domain-containing protein n=1 Tax=Trifolium subterraneum TaxID=3900 RepID=A0A2Z6NFZ2_TRISU|nr:hypothetical protein TSUD_245130 [Trifolium subterraneum]
MEHIMLVKEEKTIPLREEISSADPILKQQHFVLVHGISGGSWCWYKIKSLMENSGYKVSCIDLKSGGIDQSDVDSVLSFDDYNQPLLDFMSSLPHNEKGVPDLSEFGDVYELGFGLGHDKPPTSAMMKREFQRKISYPLSPHEDWTLAAMLLRPGPILALMSARFEENGEVEKVPRVYIRTKQDKVVKPEQQEAMIKKWPPLNVYELENSDHNPFFSSPFILFGLLVKVAATFEVGCNYTSIAETQRPPY